MKKYHRGAGFIILVMALVFSLSSLRTGIIHASNPSSAPAACNDMPDAEARTLTVAFSPVPGICAPDAYGSHKGLLVDYLNEIAKYNNWDYEYISVDPDLLLDEFLTGKYDLLGGIFYLKSYESRIAYPKYSMGNSKAVLLCQKDDPDIKSYELNTLNGK